MAKTKLFPCQMCNENKTEDPELLCHECTQFVTDEADRRDKINKSDW